MKSLCALSSHISKEIYTLLSESKLLKYQFGEEGITDKVLYSFIQSGNIHIHTIPMTKYQEARNGADWEWWVIPSDNKFPPLRFRIQAKICSIKNDSFEQIYYVSQKRRVYQHEILFDKAWRDGAVPLYCLFTHIEPNATHGCMILDSFEYMDCHSKNSKLATDVLENAYPMPDLICLGDEYAQNPSLPTLDKIREKLQYHSSFYLEKITNQAHPTYVRSIMEGNDVFIDPKLGIKKIIIQTGFSKD